MPPFRQAGRSARSEQSSGAWLATKDAASLSRNGAAALFDNNFLFSDNPPKGRQVDEVFMIWINYVQEVVGEI